MSDTVYGLRSGEVTGSLTFDDPGSTIFDEWVGESRTLQITHEFQWTRWHRAINAFLRFMLWPIGPSRLPADYTLTLPGMRIVDSTVEGDTVSVDFSPGLSPEVGESEGET